MKYNQLIENLSELLEISEMNLRDEQAKNRKFSQQICDLLKMVEIKEKTIKSYMKRNQDEISKEYKGQNIFETEPSGTIGNRAMNIDDLLERTKKLEQDALFLFENNN